MFIDKCCVFMGDFMNAQGTSEMMDIIKAEALEEFVAHRDKYNPGGGWWPVDNRAEIENKFEDAKKWLAGYTEQGWWGQTGTTYLPRTDYFYQFIRKQWNLGDPVVLTVNKENKDNIEITLNGNKLSGNIFDGKYFVGRTITLSAEVEEGKDPVTGWDVSGAINKEYAGNTLTIEMPNGEIAINPLFIEVNAIDEIRDNTIKNGAIYDLLGNKVENPQTGRIYIQNGKKFVMK